MVNDDGEEEEAADQLDIDDEVSGSIEENGSPSMSIFQIIFIYRDLH